jgi:hypothetical protein
MNTGNRDQGTGIRTSDSGDFEETLRLIARISAPEGIEERVQAGLRKAKTSSPARARFLPWPFALRFDNAWMQNMARAAAAAAIVAVVAGGGWSVSSRFQPSQPTNAIVLPPHNAIQGGFSSAGAMRTPQTLNGPIVAVPATVNPAATMQKPSVKKSLHHGKFRSAKNPAAPTNR